MGDAAPPVFLRDSYRNNSPSCEDLILKPAEYSTADICSPNSLGATNLKSATYEAGNSSMDESSEEAKTAAIAATGAGQAGMAAGGAMGAVSGGVTGWGIGVTQGTVLGLILGLFLGTAMARH